MKKIVKFVSVTLMTLLLVCGSSFLINAEETPQMKTGIFIEDIDISGMTAEEATAAVEDYITEMQDMPVILRAAQGNEIEVCASDFGMEWSNPEIIDEAISLGKSGNMIARYKELKDLETNGVTYNLEYSFDDTMVAQVIQEKCAEFDQHAQNATMERVNGEFVIHEEIAGAIVDEAASVEAIKTALSSGENMTEEGVVIELVAKVEEPVGTAEDLAQVKDLLGTFTTSYSSSGTARSANVANGASLINGSVIYPGEEYSFYDNVKPFTYDNGYYMAGSYLSGMVVDSMGGGICQVSTTLYNAVLMAELEVTERHNHSMIVTYTQVSGDAAISESAGKDFRFVNNTGAPIYIEGITTDEKKITFNIYGVETRDENRTIAYENVILEVIQPDYEKIIADAGQGVGYVKVQSAHVGYKAQLWKVVYVDGVEVSREQVNSSSYSMSPRTAVVGINTANPQRQEEILAAIGTGSIDHVKGVAAQLYAQEVAEAAAAAPQ
ncbi:MAG: hypothetical protein E7284_08410 [Lachnospiraceae bacterium]|nr:hypothetical protein [Lachnospiraceae bacterium]